MWYSTAYHPQTDAMSERINQKVDIALRHHVTVVLMHSDGLQDEKREVSPLLLAYIETEGVIDASYLCTKPLKGDYHLQNLRLRRAMETNNLRFLRGVELLMRDRYIADPQFWSRYKESRDSLTRVIMQIARMIFVTTSSAQKPFRGHTSSNPTKSYPDYLFRIAWSSSRS